MDDILLAELAVTNPTLFQMQLLRSAEAIRHFLLRCGESPPLPLSTELRCALAVIDPSPSQLRLLTTTEAVEAFVQHKLPPPPKDPISAMHELVSPELPMFRWLPTERSGTFHAEYSVQSLVATGVGCTKRQAKMRAAAEMNRLLLSSD